MVTVLGAVELLLLLLVVMLAMALSVTEGCPAGATESSTLVPQAGPMNCRLQ